ncbi:hypothetical protein OHR68_05850 [Spirillospora sp. NBC_00431]
MTTSKSSSVSDFSPQRRSLLLFGGLSVASTAALSLGNSGTAFADKAAAPPQIEFDLDKDNYLKALGPNEQNPSQSINEDIFGSMDISAFLWLNRITAIAAFDAVAPYHKTAVGIYAKIKRRPASEATIRNMNISGLFAGWRVWQGVFGESRPAVREFMKHIGLNPDDQSTDPTTPVGIGNIAGKAAFEAHIRDGMNVLGDEGRKYNPRPWADYTGYKPVNSPFELTNPSRWQPQLHRHNGRRVGGGHGDMGIYVVQHMVTPQAARTKTLTFRSPRDFKVPPPDFSDHTDRRRYRRSADVILKASAELTDEQKVLTEVMDDKRWGIGFSAVVILLKHDQKGEQGIPGWAFFLLVHTLATFEAAIAAWYQKVKYDAVRPVTAIQHVYGKRKVTAWGGPGKGTVDDIPADEWNSYLPVGDHPEYPSGSTTLCAAASQAARRYWGSDVLDWKFTFRAGASKTEPGIVPAKDIELHFPTWTDFTTKCGHSRVWGGVHFPETIEASFAFGKQFGDLAFDYVDRHIKGQVKG